jgi:peptidoglycan/LPS O-acetylase OafA/YrhL
LNIIRCPRPESNDGKLSPAPAAILTFWMACAAWPFCWWSPIIRFIPTRRAACWPSCLIGGSSSRVGWGVPIFFVLSGFLISYPFFQKREADPQFWYQRGYIWRRVGKILPPFYLSIIFFLVLAWFRGDFAASLDSAWKWAAGVANFLPMSLEFNPSYWSLLVESHFYLLLPVLFWLTRGFSVSKTGGLIFLTLFLVPLVVRQMVWPAGIYLISESDTELQKEIMIFKLTRFPCKLDYFAWGVLFASLFVPLQKIVGRENLRPLGVLGYAGVALMSLTMLAWGIGDQVVHGTRLGVEVGHLLPAVATLLMLFFIFDRQSLGARILSLSWLRFIGIVSYEWFLFHGPLVCWYHEFFPNHTHGNLLAYALKELVPLALTFGLSVLVYRYFSLPILHRIRDHLKNEKQKNEA